MATPNLILIGCGVVDSLQLTVEAQRVLARFGSAYAVGLPPNLAAYLKSQRVKVTDLSGRLAGREYAEGYLDLAAHVVERTAHERPVILLVPGHPLMFNAVGRYLAAEGRRLELGVQVVAAPSPLDVIIGGIGLDVSTFGLQVFDATRLVARSQAVNPQVPAILMHVGGFGAAAPGVKPALAALAAYLARCYPPSHPATLVWLGAEGMRAASVPLERLAERADEVDSGSHLFLDAVRPTPPGQTA